ncbi:hypothetical protein IC229_33120 [Spirosoma sp. BT702]|uniref:Uncharacterized protein n=1 Tax=Spirosoma profusum TaxID=2771354 RepID=A0A927AW26_9BACT|nr:hypothetical protein [Spirosoma profusum]MBD2705500.1 hypothetical protein [Spirosoma profusum]
MSAVPACGVPGGSDPYAGRCIPNIESSNDWKRTHYGNRNHWPSWESSKNHEVILESSAAIAEFGPKCTVEQLFSKPGAQYAEEGVRRSNRLVLLHKVIKQKGYAGLVHIYGSCAYQGNPRVSALAEMGSQFMVTANCDVSNIGGSSSGNITLNGQSYVLTGNQYDHEDATLGYFYNNRFDISEQDYNDIWNSKLPHTQNYPHLWSKMFPTHVVGREKAFWQLVRGKMLHNQRTLRGMIRMAECVYEADECCYVNNAPRGVRAPFGQLFNTFPELNDSPKVWQPPHDFYSTYMVARFFGGNDENNGLHIFPSNNNSRVRGDLNSSDWASFNHELHTYTALLQARKDMQALEGFFPGSSLIEDPEVKLNEAGSFSAYSGVVAYNDADGGPINAGQKPAVMLRYKVLPGIGWTVWILIGSPQGYNDSRTDLIRVSASGLNGNIFKVKSIGCEAQLHEFVVKSSDSGQTYEAINTIVLSERKPGYAGRIQA